MIRRTRRGFVAAAAALPMLPRVAAAGTKTDVYGRLGVKPLINGMGTVTVVGGSLMPAEVRQAMDEASRHFVDLPDLQRKVGERLASLLKVPAAMVTAGAASAIAVGTAACITRGNSERCAELPDTEGLPNEVIIQKSHRSGYEAQMRVMGGKPVWVESREELDRAIGPRTAMMFFMNKAAGGIDRQEWIRIAKRHKVPTFNDAAADVPPAGRLTELVEQGFDLVAFSGGKGLRGPQCSGLLLGRKDLIDAGYPAISPSGGPGRGMKVGKEELIGLLAAVELYLRTDHDAVRRSLETRVSEMIRTLTAGSGIKAEQYVPQIANEVPHVLVSWDEAKSGKSTEQVLKALRGGDPPIAVLGNGQGRLLVSVWMMQESEHRVVARRIREILG